LADTLIEDLGIDDVLVDHFAFAGDFRFPALDQGGELADVGLGFSDLGFGGGEVSLGHVDQRFGLAHQRRIHFDLGRLDLHLFLQFGDEQGGQQLVLGEVVADVDVPLEHVGRQLGIDGGLLVGIDERRLADDALQIAHRGLHEADARLGAHRIDGVRRGFSASADGQKEHDCQGAHQESPLVEPARASSGSCSCSDSGSASGSSGGS
jgi:hypothetical protein